jgi:hypothetical protein
MVKQTRQRSRRHTKRRILVHSYATGPAAGPAFLVRGSSRRIITMMAGHQARSTNIRLINRRQSRLDRCRVCLTGRKKHPITKYLLKGRSISGVCPSIRRYRVPSATGADARRRDAGDVDVHRRGAPTPQMPPCRRNPKGAWVLRAISALLVVNDVHRHRLLLAP